MTDTKEVIAALRASRSTCENARGVPSALETIAADTIEALAAKLADADERIEELEAACEVVSSEFEGELWVACRRILKKTGFDFSNSDGVQADAFEEHINDTLEAAETALATARRDALKEAADMIQVGIKRRQPALTKLTQKLSASKMADFKYRVIRAEVDAMQSCRDKILALTTEGEGNE